MSSKNCETTMSVEISPWRVNGVSKGVSSVRIKICYQVVKLFSVIFIKNFHNRCTEVRRIVLEHKTFSRKLQECYPSKLGIYGNYAPYVTSKSLLPRWFPDFLTFLKRCVASLYVGTTYSKPSKSFIQRGISLGHFFISYCFNS